ncbi:hypothetical protein [Candidatus Nitrosacidococcus sp. I8]|uniref:hypothetical protein n=1 Tax=Candidatus Nitrosacidococcus sp. I8 TaxID=2942908 RepID=UPI0022274C5D|nr:hypothetical protein [Candidatus Nitrosacidococcus sp. I8]CAH9018263.1 hypothetical protein NURINAE_00825 [Candidatus Nitrosacidococcus sp. I8]
MSFLKENRDLKKIAWLGLGIFLILLIHTFYKYHIHINWAIMDDSAYTHYLFNYQDGFIKRGLVGEIFRQLDFQMSYKLAHVIGYCVFIIASFSLLIAIICPFKGYWQSTGFLLFFLFALSNSGTFQGFYRTLGHFDNINFILSLLCIFLIYKIKKPPVYILAYALMVIAILIHEAALLMFIPLVLAFSFYLDSSKKNILQLLLLSGALLLTTTAVFYNGMTKNSTLDEHYSELVNTYGDHVYYEAVEVLHDRGLEENYLYVKNKKSAYKAKENKRILILLLPTLLIYLLFCYEEIKRDGYSKKLILLASAFSPLALYPIAASFYRWWGMSITNFFVAMALIAATDKSFREFLVSFFYRHQNLTLIAIVFCTIGGSLRY